MMQQKDINKMYVKTFPAQSKNPDQGPYLKQVSISYEKGNRLIQVKKTALKKVGLPYKGAAI